MLAILLRLISGRQMAVDLQQRFDCVLQIVNWIFLLLYQVYISYCQPWESGVRNCALGWLVNRIRI